MIYIDICIFTKKVKFNIFRSFSNNIAVLKKNEIVLPSCYCTGQKLNYIRELVSILIDSYDIKHFKVNIDGQVSWGVYSDSLKEAIKIEGILEELFSSRGVKLWI